MTYVAIMQVNGQECAKYQKFDSEAQAEAHISEHIGRFPDAFVVPMPSFPMNRWVCDPASQTITDKGPDADKEAERAVAVLSKEAFCTQLLELDILPPDEAAAAARGEWPATFASVTAGMPVKEAGKAQIKWAAAQDIHYSAPLLQGLALAYANGDPDGATAVLDLIFGIA